MVHRKKLVEDLLSPCHYRAGNPPKLRPVPEWVLTQDPTLMSMRIDGDYLKLNDVQVNGIRSVQSGRKIPNWLHIIGDQVCYINLKGECLEILKEDPFGVSPSAGTPSIVVPISASSASSFNVYKDAQHLFNGYNLPKFAFPRWCFDQTYVNMHNSLAKKTIVFYDRDDSNRFLDVKKTVAQREPVNIGMDTDAYNKTHLYKHFGYQRSYYREYYAKHKDLAPNIAIYCETPATTYSPENDIVALDPANMVILRVLNVVAYGFDSPKQPDHKKIKTKTELKRRKRYIFDKILACVQHFRESNCPIKWLFLPKFGTGAFAGANEFVVDVFDELCAEYVPLLQDAGVDEVETGLIFNDGDYFGNTLKPYTTWKKHATSEIPLKSRLYINAWDPHSIIGNGNFNDVSLDGYFGRCTAMSLLGWSKTNPFLRYKST